MREYAVGDRVHCKGNPAPTPGTVVALRPDDGYAIDWDDGYDDGGGNVFGAWELEPLEDQGA